MVSEETVEAARFRGTDVAKVSSPRGETIPAPWDQSGQSTLCLRARGGMWKRDLKDEFPLNQKGA